MKRRELVERYLDAWNRRDVAAVLELFHPGAAVYDALWRESCAGQFLPKYIQDGLEEDEYWYELTDELIYFDEGVIYRYAGYEWDGSQIGEKRFEGAEVMTVVNSRILTLSNYYYDPDPKVLMEVAKLSISRHGEPTYVRAASSGYKQVHVKHRLLHMMASDNIAVDRTLSVAGLAEKVGCNVDDLLRLVEEEFGTEIKDYVGREHTRYAVELLNR
jgi:hypothetical protein